MAEFSYDTVKLLENEIRIFKLLPCSNTELDEIIKVELFTASVEILPEFIALSYHWGHPDSELQWKRNILVDSRHLSITTSLESSLRALRKLYGGQQFWADQICIDQRSKEEKKCQIPYMYRIFSESAQTIAWLGTNIPCSAATQTSLEQLGRQAREIGCQIDPDQFHQLYNLEKDDIERQNPVDLIGPRQKLRQFLACQGDMLKIPGFDGIIKLCEAEYFVRGWIREELALPRHLLLRWDDGYIDGDTFSAAVLLLEICSHHWLSMRRDDVVYNVQHQHKTWAIHDPVQPSVAVRMRYQDQQYRTSRFFNMAHILRRFRHLEFTEPEDRVLGVHALVNDKEALGLSIDHLKSK